MNNTTPTKIKVLDGGKGQLSNQFDKPTESDYYKRKSEGESWGDYLYKQWNAFDKANPAYDIISPLSVKVGDEISATLKWFGLTQINGNDYGDWFMLTYNSDALTPEEWEIQGWKIKQAWQLTPEKEGEEKPVEIYTDKIYCPYWVQPAHLETLGYKDDNHSDGADRGYYKYLSHGGVAKHREGRECEQPLWDGKREIWFNCTYAVADKAVYCKVYEDAGTRTVFNGVLFTPEQLNLILNLVE